MLICAACGRELEIWIDNSDEFGSVEFLCQACHDYGFRLVVVQKTKAELAEEEK